VAYERVKPTFYVGIKIIDSLPPSVTILKNEKAKFKAVIRNYQYTHSLYAIDKFVMCNVDI
jgi:hypothetical protein